jgi:hypothetical protein
MLRWQPEDGTMRLSKKVPAAPDREYREVRLDALCNLAGRWPTLSTL